jgi:hypothetical protein
MLTGVVLIIVAVFFRLSSPALGTWNLVPMGAVALYAGARLPRRWAWIVPVSAFILSDLYLDHGAGRSVNEMWRWVNYVTFAATTLIGPLARVRKLGFWRYPALALGASTLFFLTSNFSVWAEGREYPMTMAGLLECYYLGIPFFGRTILADLAGTAVLFGLGPIIERAASRVGLTKKPAAECDLLS